MFWDELLAQFREVNFDWAYCRALLSGYYKREDALNKDLELLVG